MVVALQHVEIRLIHHRESPLVVVVRVHRISSDPLVHQTDDRIGIHTAHHGELGLVSNVRVDVLFFLDCRCLLLLLELVIVVEPLLHNCQSNKQT